MSRLASGRSALRLFRRMTRAATALMAPRRPATKRPVARAVWRPAPGMISTVPHFGTNPGALTLQLYTPRRAVPPGMPLILLLHGCRQDAASFATNTGWLAWAEAAGVPLVLPGQVAANQRHRCFNWYRTGDVARGLGEAMSIRQALRFAMGHFASDRRRVFIAGLSAGGAMTAALLAAYPAVFAAGAVVAGMPVGVAQNSPMALLRMARTDPFGSRAALVLAARAAAPPRRTASWPRLSIWQGGADRVVNPENAELLAAQWGGLHGCDEEPMEDSTEAPGLRRRAWGRPGRPAVELWTLPEMAHGFPIAAGAGRAGPWVLDTGIAAVPRIAEFWGLEAGRIRPARS